MIDLNIKNNGDMVVTEYLLKPNDRIDNLTLGMLVNNKIEGVLPVIPVQIENQRYFRYDITGMVTLKKYLGDYIKKERILKAFYKIALAIRESKEYMINWTSFSLEQKDIYINEETGEVGLICLPILSVINDGNICNFLKNILFSAQFDLEENGDYVGKLITILNPKTYDIEKFIYELEDMMEIEHKVFDKDDVQEEEEKPVPVQKKEETEVEAIPVVDEIEESGAEAVPVVDEIEESGAEAVPVVGEIEESGAETVPVVDEIEESGAETVPVVDETTEETEVETVPVVDETTEETEVEAVPVPEDVTEESLEQLETPAAENRNDIKSDTVEVRTENLGQETGSPVAVKEETEKDMARPFLIKVSDNQKIIIDKDRFVIGKDKEKVDYCIADNPSIIDEHAFIIRHDKEFFLIDNNSNYTFMNRVLIQPEEEVYIPHGAHLSFADEDYEFRMHE